MVVLNIQGERQRKREHRPRAQLEMREGFPLGKESNMALQRHIARSKLVMFQT